MAVPRSSRRDNAMDLFNNTHPSEDARTRGARARRSRAGYTAMEVVVSIALFTVGGSGVIAMENMAVQGNAGARRLDQAANVGNALIDTLQKNASVWKSGAEPALFDIVDGATWNPYPKGWDLSGVSNVAANPIFCAQYKSTALKMDAANANPVLIRFDVLVYWQKDMNAITAGCAAAIAVASAPSTYHVIYFTALAKPQP